MLPDAYIVRYRRNGVDEKFITLEASKAYEYAAKHHGVVGFLDERIRIPKEDEFMAAKEILPWESTT